MSEIVCEKHGSWNSEAYPNGCPLCKIEEQDKVVGENIKCKKCGRIGRWYKDENSNFMICKCGESKEIE